eukprot:jgi/Mesvir1/28860/Mv25182-RA.1
MLRKKCLVRWNTSTQTSRSHHPANTLTHTQSQPRLPDMRRANCTHVAFSTSEHRTCPWPALSSATSSSLRCPCSLASLAYRHHHNAP